MKASGYLFRIMILLVSVFMFSRNALAQYRDYYGWGMGPGMMGWGGVGWFGPLFSVPSLWCFFGC